MVNKKNVSGRQDLPLPKEGASRKELKIAGGPLYLPADVCRVLREGTISLWTYDCADEVTYKLEWELDDVRALILLAMERGVFKGSEWCDQNGTGPIAACDAYTVNRMELVKNAKKDMEMSYFVKFAISKTGALLLVVSCHL